MKTKKSVQNWPPLGMRGVGLPFPVKIRTETKIYFPVFEMHIFTLRTLVFFRFHPLRSHSVHYLPTDNNIFHHCLQQIQTLIMLGESDMQYPEVYLLDSVVGFERVLFHHSNLKHFKMCNYTVMSISKEGRQKSSIPWLGIGVIGSSISFNVESKFNFIHRMCWKLRNQCLQCQKVQHFVVIETN